METRCSRPFSIGGSKRYHRRRFRSCYSLEPRYVLRFVLIDRLLALEPGKRASARADFSHAGDVLEDHFPGRPIIPGVLLTEAMAQTAGWLLASTLGFGRWPLLVMIDRAKFRRVVEPGEDLRLGAEIRSMHADDFAVDTEVRIGEELVADARLMFHAFDFALAGPDHERFEQWAHRIFLDIGGPQLLAAAAASPPPEPA